MDRNFIQASKEMDMEEEGSTGQVTGHQFKKESSEKEKEVDTGWWSWWKKEWPVLGTPEAREGAEEENIPSEGEEVEADRI